MAFELKGRRVWIAGHRGMVGAALLRRLQREPVTLLAADRAALDLRRQADVETWVEKNKPEAIIIAAAKVGGIKANDAYPVDFLYDNLAIQTNILRAAAEQGVARVMVLGSSCVYPKLAEQPIKEETLLTAPLEPTNQWYALAKIAAMKLAESYRRQHGRDFVSVVPTNLYGPGDNFDLEQGHVISALMRKIHEAKQAGRDAVEIWGTGNPKREFVFVDDAADGLVFLLQNYAGEDPINLAGGEEVSIRELAGLLAEIINYQGRFEYLTDRPDGMPRKLLDSQRISKMGWVPSTSLRDGLMATYRWFAQTRL
ncbi:GDP-L-fucose synthase family protein [Desertibaculum subflavum]|uniref:GDP-L-fucose synthase family protein n=1 Tax=Desertibaculum subflavum TaxID=2268458 RepID=UPI000E668632